MITKPLTLTGMLATAAAVVVVDASRELIEGACQTGWTKMLRRRLRSS